MSFVYLGYRYCRCLANTLSQSVLCLSTVSFEKDNFLILIKSNIFFMDHVFGVAGKNSSPNPRTQDFISFSSSTWLICFHLTIRSMVSFKLIFL